MKKLSWTKGTITFSFELENFVLKFYFFRLHDLYYICFEKIYNNTHNLNIIDSHFYILLTL